jgi:hypothetical protein
MRLCPIGLFDSEFFIPPIPHFLIDRLRSVTWNRKSGAICRLVGIEVPPRGFFQLLPQLRRDSVV